MSCTCHIQYCTVVKQLPRAPTSTHGTACMEQRGLLPWLTKDRHRRGDEMLLYLYQSDCFSLVIGTCRLGYSPTSWPIAQTRVWLTFAVELAVRTRPIGVPPAYKLQAASSKPAAVRMVMLHKQRDGETWLDQVGSHPYLVQAVNNSK